MERGGEELREHGHREGGGEVGVAVRHAVLLHQLVADGVLCLWGFVDVLAFVGLGGRVWVFNDGGRVVHAVGLRWSIVRFVP